MFWLTKKKKDTTEADAPQHQRTLKKPQDAAVIFEKCGFDDLAQTESMENIEAQMVARKGKKIPVSVNGVALKDQQGIVHGFVIAATDLSKVQKLQKEQLGLLTEQKREEDEDENLLPPDETTNNDPLQNRNMDFMSRELNLRAEYLEQEKAKGDALLASIGEGVVATDDRSFVVFTNEVARAMLECKQENVAFKPIDKVVHVVDEKGRAISKTKRPVHIALTSKEKTSSSTFFFVRRDKTSFPVSITAAPVQLNKKVIGAIMVFRDITREKEIDQAKTEFVSLASHQLRTPLSAINWYAEMLLSGDAGKLNNEQTQYVQEVFNGNQRMIRLVNALLNVSRIDLGTFSVEVESVNVVSVSDSVIAELIAQIKTKKIDVKKEYGEDIPTLSADPKLVRIIFQNLLSNAVKYTPEKGKVTVTIKKDAQKGHLSISIADTGYGIPKHQQNFVFSKLFRADNVIARETEGTGLGLYIVKSIVTQSGGKVWFTSEENKGTTFFVTLPLSGMKPKKGNRELTFVG